MLQELTQGETIPITDADFAALCAAIDEVPVDTPPRTLANVYKLGVPAAVVTDSQAPDRASFYIVRGGATDKTHGYVQLYSGPAHELSLPPHEPFVAGPNCCCTIDGDMDCGGARCQRLDGFMQIDPHKVANTELLTWDDVMVANIEHTLLDGEDGRTTGAPTMTGVASTTICDEDPFSLFRGVFDTLVGDVLDLCTSDTSNGVQQPGGGGCMATNPVVAGLTPLPATVTEPARKTPTKVRAKPRHFPTEGVDWMNLEVPAFNEYARVNKISKANKTEMGKDRRRMKNRGYARTSRRKKSAIIHAGNVAIRTLEMQGVASS
tara:strand:+ start:366 stop:1328 length:963 start_codon:yes stop_codon:yes gene_type:complete